METKWWEYYAVRYFAGTVIGAAIVAFLNAEQGSPFKDSLTIISKSSEAAFLGVGLIVALGFAFCYVASSPMLTLHAARAHLHIRTIRSSRSRFGLCVVVAVGVSILILWRFLPPVAAAASGFVVGSQCCVVFLAIGTRFTVIEDFYRGLAEVRANAIPQNAYAANYRAEYITSYRHLREHGNAVSIVVLEFVLAYALLRSPSQTFAAALVLVWLIPSTFAWMLGTVLESRLVRPLTEQSIEPTQLDASV